MLRRILSAVIGGALVLSALGTAHPVSAQEPIRIGEINSYTRLPAFLEPYRKGYILAVEQANAAGGIDGRPLEVLERDDGGKPGDAVRLAEELVRREKVVMLVGGFLSNVGLAVSDYAAQRRVLFLASEPLSDKLVWENGNRYTFRLRPSTTMQAAMLAEQAAKLGVTRWATVAPNYAYGQDAVAAFRAELLKRQPDAQFVADFWPPVFDIDAAATVSALAAADPEAIFNVTFAGDLQKFVREGTLRGLFEGRPVVSMLSGEPEYLESLGADTPEGWIVTGYPWSEIETPEHTAFRQAYEARWGEPPKVGSLVGYNAMLSVVALLKATPAIETEAMVDTLRGLTLDTPVGPITYREIDHQSTMGAYVGKLSQRDGQGIMVDWFYADGADYLPDDEEVRTLRPAP